MNVTDLNGNITNWSITGHIDKAYAKKSSFHIQAREILKRLYPTMQILEEVTISIRRSETLYLDFYLPLNKTCIEVHGEQHYEFTPFYHPNKMAFLKSQKRDREKKEWCDINGISYIELPYNQTDNWENIIVNN